MNWNWVFRRVIIGPLVRVVFPTRVKGIENLPKKGAFVLVIGPHKTHIETVLIPVFLARRPLHFLVKEKYWIHPIIGWFLRATGQINTASGSYRAALADLRAGNPIAVFPEGTRHQNDPDVHEGHSGAFRMAEEAGVTIYVAALKGMDDTSRFTRKSRREIVIEGPFDFEPRGDGQDAMEWASQQTAKLMWWVAFLVNLKYVG